MSNASITIDNGLVRRGVTTTLLKLESMFNANGIASFYIPHHTGIDNIEVLREHCTEAMKSIHQRGVEISIGGKSSRNVISLSYTVDPEMEMDMRDLLSEFLIYITQERIPIFDIPPSLNGITLFLYDIS